MLTQSSFGTWFVGAHFAEAMHGSISADCAVGTKYYLTVRWSCSRLQCLWTHVVQITNPFRKRIAIRDGFQNVIRSFVNRPWVYCCFHDVITPILQNLHWLPVNIRITYKINLLTYKSNAGLSPTYLSDLLHDYVPSRTLRSTSQSLLQLPRRIPSKSYGQRSLPQQIRTADSVKIF